MFESHSITSLFLTAGGSAPAVHSVGVDSQVEDDGELRPLPASAYALDLDLRQGVLACGTRAGTIHLFPVSSEGDGQEPAEPVRFLAGRAITSLCFVADGGLISADESGRILQWWGEGEDANHPARWDSGGDAVCLLGSTEAHVVGLGDEGQVLVWRECDASLGVRLVAPAPARPIALARLASWTLKAGSVVVYPGGNGQLVMIGADPPSVRVAAAHEGRWYAAFQVDERLATIGYDDGIIKFWRLADGQPVCIDERPALYGVTDAEVFFAGSPQGIAVLSNGRAVRFTITQDSFTVLDAIPGKCFRTVAGASVRSQRELEVQQRQRRADELQDWIATSIDAGAETDLSEAFGELESLCPEDVSLALKAHRAMRTCDLLLELELRHRLAQLLPRDSHEAQPSHERYIALLLEFGQYEAALEVISQFGQTPKGGATGYRPRWLSAVIDAMHAGQDVIFAGPDRSAPIDQIIAAARIVGRPLQGLWEIHRSGRMLMPDTVVQPGQLAIAIEDCNHETFGFSVRTCASRVLWVEKEAAFPSEVVVSSPHWDKPCEHFKVLLRTTTTPGGTELTRSIVLAPGVNERGSGDPACSRELFEKIAAVKEQGGRAAILAPLNKLIRRTLQGLRGAAVAQGSCGFGGAL